MKQLASFNNTKCRWSYCMYIANKMVTSNVRTKILVLVIICACFRSNDSCVIKMQDHVIHFVTHVETVQTKNTFVRCFKQECEFLCQSYKKNWVTLNATWCWMVEIRFDHLHSLIAEWNTPLCRICFSRKMMLLLLTLLIEIKTISKINLTTAKWNLSLHYCWEHLTKKIRCA